MSKPDPEPQKPEGMSQWDWDNQLVPNEPGDNLPPITRGIARMKARIQAANEKMKNDPPLTHEEVLAQVARNRKWMEENYPEFITAPGRLDKRSEKPKG